MNKSISFLFIYLFVCFAVSAQTIEKSLSKSDDSFYIEPPRLSAYDSINLISIPVIPIPANYKSLPSLPAVCDLSPQPYLRPVFQQSALECGQASGIGMGFTYDMCWDRNVPANVTTNQYPTHFAWDFMNSGISTGVSFFDTWTVLRDFGTMNVYDYGGTMWYGGYTRWISGYQNYYHGMHNRIKEIYTIPVRTPQELKVLKHWIYDHLDGSSVGCVANFYANVPTLYTLPAGTPEAGKRVIISWSYANHAMTIVGFNDSIRYDYNNDGQYTNNIDINSDGVVDMKDWEIGGLKMCNTYGGGPAWGDQGFAYMTYRSLAMAYGSGGIWSNSVYVLYTRENIEPMLTMKITLKHNSRNKIKVTTGVAIDTLAVVPEIIKEYPIFKFQGGNFFMQGGTTEADKTIEFGLDISPYLNYVGIGNPAKYFLKIQEEDPTNVGTGQLISFSLMDYTNGSVEIPSTVNNLQLTENGFTTVSLIHATNFNQCDIVNDTLAPATVFEPYTFQLTASGGTTPYYWDFDHTYDETDTSYNFSSFTGGTSISFSNYGNGTTNQTLPFAFPFFDTTYNEVKINVDGFLMFNALPPTWPYQIDANNYFIMHESICPFYANLYITTTSGHGVWYTGDVNSATFRWKAQLNNQSGTEVNFAVKLYPNGNIEFYYGNMNYPTNTYWYSGIFKGDCVHSQYCTNSGYPTISTNKLLKYEQPEFPPELSLSREGIITGTPVQEYIYYPLKVLLTDGSNIIDRDTVIFYTSGVNSTIITGHSVVSGNDNVIEFGEDAILSIDFENLSTFNFSNSSFKLTTTDPYITLTDSIEYIGNILPSEIFTLNNAFSFHVANDIPDNHLIVLGTFLYTQLDTFHSHIFLNGYAAAIQLGEVEIQDAVNSSLDPGETANMLISFQNSGGAKLTDATAIITSSNPLITINSGTSIVDSILSDNSNTFTFTVTASNLATIGQMIDFEINLTAQNDFAYNGTFSIPIGLVSEDFNEGYYELPGWNFSGDSHWFADNTLPYEGDYCAKSGTITHNQQSNFYINCNVLASGNMRFYWKVSSETNYDFLNFYVDGNELGHWSGEIGWTLATYPVTSGNHTFKWTYLKDYSVNTNSDCAWVDYICFPPIGNLTVGIENPEILTNDNLVKVFPNPFQSLVDIEIQLTKPSIINAEIFTSSGELIRILSENSLMQAGNQILTWNGMDKAGKVQSNGVYYLKITDDNSVITKKLVLIK